MSVSDPEMADGNLEPGVAGGILHKPVLAGELVDLLGIRPGGIYIDCTVGSGGHAALILERAGGRGRLLGLDRDPAALGRAAGRLRGFGAQYAGMRGDFSRLAAVAANAGFEGVDGIVMDVGVSSEQLADPARGFSFMHDGPLDMRMDPSGDRTAADLVNGLTEEELERIIREYGEDRMARRIAGAIARERVKAPFVSTAALSGVVAAAAGGRRGKIHPATRTFQALRIAVNNELEALGRGIGDALGLLRPGGRLAVITFHSLEDRIVKNIYREHAGWRESLESGGSIWRGKKPAVTILTRKPVTASEGEIAVNPRSRTAKLRVAERL